MIYIELKNVSLWCNCTSLKQVSSGCSNKMFSLLTKQFNILFMWYFQSNWTWTQAWNFIFERARPFSFCKGHFNWKTLKPMGNLCRGTRAKFKGNRGNWPLWSWCNSRAAQCQDWISSYTCQGKHETWSLPTDTFNAWWANRESWDESKNTLVAQKQRL